MSLIVIKEIGYGFEGDKLDMTIAIPKDSYLNSFWVCTQKDISTKCSTIRGAGIEYISAIQNYWRIFEHQELSVQEAFLKLFEYVESYTDEETSNVYDVYKIKQSIDWHVDVNTTGSSIKVSKEDLTLITLYLDVETSTDFVIPTECGEDSSVVTVPLYDLLTLRLKALRIAEGLDSDCNIPRLFIDKILQLKAIELALCCEDYCKALEYWKLFYSQEIVGKVKKCGCHG